MNRKDSMNTAFLSLGGNLGSRMENLNRALADVKEKVGKVLKASQIYETDAWGSSSKKKYLNQVVKVQTHLSASELLATTLSIEKKLGRKRTGKRYSDRSTDIDVLFFNTDIIQHTDLQLPHPRLHLRKFILVPLNDIEKDWIHPVLKKKVSRLLKECTDELAVNVYKERAKRLYICIEGNIGSGKSTLAAYLAKKMKAVYVPEKFEENDLLPLFYSNPRTYAFPLEYSFLISRFQELSACFRTPGPLVVSDFSFYKSLWFAKVNLPGKEYKLFKKHFGALLKELPGPDLIVFLDTDLKNLRQNIKKRGRPYEQQIPDQYLKALAKNYRAGLLRVTAKKLYLRVKEYHPGLNQESSNAIGNYIKENFGKQGQKSYI